MCKINKKRWDDKEIEFLIENYLKMKNKDISFNLKKSICSVNSKASRLGLKKIRWTEKEEQYLKENYNKNICKDLAKELNRTTYSVSQRLSKLRLIKTPKEKSIIAKKEKRNWKSGKDHYKWKGGKPKSICKFCGKEFVGEFGNPNKFCSRKCSSNGRENVMYKKEKTDKIKIKELKDLYANQKLSCKKIGKIFGVSLNTIYSLLKQNFITIDHYGRKRKYKITKIICSHCGKEFERDNWRLKRKDRKSSDFFCSKKCSHEHYKSNNSPNWKGGDKEVNCENCNKIIIRDHYEYKNHKMFFCSKKCWGKWISKNMFGENHPRWKGGIYKTSDGYIIIKSPNHPNKDGYGYFKEHRMVMEKVLGRYLDKKEVVHHINGIRDDNRKENLKLFKNNYEHQKFHGSLNKSPHRKIGTIKDLSNNYIKEKIVEGGYIKIFINGEWILEHRYLVEQFIKRKLDKQEVIHHINENRVDNRIKNLMVFENSSKHQRFHLKLRQFGTTNPIARQIDNRWDNFPNIKSK